jgi:aminoglycoside 6'-N-acetyltransferase I
MGNILNVGCENDKLVRNRGQMYKMKISGVKAQDKEQWLRMRIGLWPDVSKEIHEQEISAMLADKHFAIFVAQETDERLLGFIEVSLREDILEGCIRKQIGYIEGLYVEPKARGLGIGRLLVEAGEKWAFENGIKDMATDTEIDNNENQKAYIALGYREADRLVLYRKKLIK